MSAILPIRPWGGDERSDIPEPRLRGTLTQTERLGRWEVRAAQWRAVELAREAFGPGVRGSLLGLRAEGSLRGLLQLDVPFETTEGSGLDEHRRREVEFLASVGNDPLLQAVPLLYVFGAVGEGGAP